MIADDTLFMIVGGAFALVFVVVVTEQVWRLWNWLKYQKAMEEVDNFVIPANYDFVKQEQERINIADSGGSFYERPEVGRKYAVSVVRRTAAKVREQGYIRGEYEQRNNIPFDIGIAANPHPKGSGAAKQWVRGYCMARNVVDPKPYYDEA